MKVYSKRLTLVVNMKYIKNVYHVFLVLFQIQLIKSEIIYCHEAVASVKIVSSCPDSKEAWDIAAHKKNCSRMAAGQTCTTADKFQYHCVINGFRNKFVEVCAPTRIIFGHCVEFNTGGGVIQDQMSAPCNSSFPKCDDIYHSTDAYKYLRHKQSKPTGRERSSHSESSAYIGAYNKKTNLSERQRSSHSESSAFTPNVHRSFENKIAPSLPFIGHRNKNDKNEDDRTERRVNECISKTI